MADLAERDASPSLLSERTGQNMQNHGSSLVGMFASIWGSYTSSKNPLIHLGREHVRTRDTAPAPLLGNWRPSPGAGDCRKDGTCSLPACRIGCSPNSRMFSRTSGHRPWRAKRHRGLSGPHHGAGRRNTSTTLSRIIIDQIMARRLTKPRSWSWRPTDLASGSIRSMGAHWPAPIASATKPMFSTPQGLREHYVQPHESRQLQLAPHCPRRT